jgi:5,10-methylenetetrahydrofolate reductase
MVSSGAEWRKREDSKGVVAPYHNGSWPIMTFTQAKYFSNLCGIDAKRAAAP